MAKLHFDRLESRYAGEDLTGKKYRSLMERIVTQNSRNISHKVAKLNRDHWDKQNAKIKNVEKKLIIPDVSSVLPSDAVHILKGAERGQVLSDELRRNLTQNLRDVLNQFTPKTKEPIYIRRRGVLAGTINPKLVDQFQKSIKETFKNYTKKDPKYGVPSNVREIAVTEVNSSINNIKASYVDRLVYENPEAKATKRWIHYPGRSKEPRIGHGIVAKYKARDLYQHFHVPLYQMRKGRWVRVGYDLMMHPHDPSAPAEQVISCHCDIEYKIRR